MNSTRKIDVIIKLFLMLLVVQMTSQNNPFQVGVVGLTHSHVHWIFNAEKTGQLDVVGIVEPNKELALRYEELYRFSMNKVYDSMEEMINATQPAAVCAFGSIDEHLEVVQKAAPLGIHVMVEKPLALNFEDAKKMEALALKHNIHLLTNYETTWYPSNHRAKLLLDTNKIGDLRKVIIRDGHKGPKKIGVDPEFLEWLVDPKKKWRGCHY